MADKVQKALAKGEARYEVRERKQGRFLAYHIYDRARASYPASVPGFGSVRQGHVTRAEAEAEIIRLIEFQEGSAS